MGKIGSGIVLIIMIILLIVIGCEVSKEPSHRRHIFRGRDGIPRVVTTHPNRGQTQQKFMNKYQCPLCGYIYWERYMSSTDLLARATVIKQSNKLACEKCLGKGTVSYLLPLGIQFYDDSDACKKLKCAIPFMKQKEIGDKNDNPK